jgi:hypothetical protein
MSAGDEAGTSRICQILDAAEKDVHCKLKPNDGLFAGTGMCIDLARCPYADIKLQIIEQELSDIQHTFALHSPSVTVLPAQLRTSWANRVASESSWEYQQGVGIGGQATIQSCAHLFLQ